MDEQKAIAGARQGDRQAFAWLMDRYKHMVYTVCHRVLRNHEEAEEAAQDSFIKVHRHLEGYQGTSRFSTWLYSIAYRTALSKLRARGGETSDLDTLEGSGHEPVELPGPDHGDRKALVEWALGRLAPEDSAVLTFFYLQELGIDEIVTITGLGESNVKVRLHRARKKMLAVLQDHLKEEAWTLTTE